MGVNDKRPCRGCKPPKRHPGCHASCPDNAKWKAEHEHIFKAIQAERDRDEQATRFLVDQRDRTARRLKLNRYK